ncbi:DUF2975 domain-containing protein [Kribbella sp. CA-247076]|uniref:DUF2975 domain-containing protein n=1 Tax=Kribbella sp. CA-247076 TaxID=3239941 RepID=UPI003D93D9B7
MGRPSTFGLSRWGRSDSRALQGLLGIAFVAVAVIGLGMPLLTLVRGIDGFIEHQVPVAGTESTTLAEADGLKLSTGDTATLSVTDPTLEQRLLLTLPSIVVAVLILFGIYLLFRIARTLSAGEPFTPRNPRRLYGLAVLIVVGTVVDGLVTAICTDQLVAGTALAGDVPFTVDVPLTQVAVAFLVAALAEAFRIGVRLRADTEGLV